MYERFTDRGRAVMQMANQKAQHYSHEYINVEHILLGLLGQPSSVAGSVFGLLTIAPARMQSHLEAMMVYGPEMVVVGRLPVEPRVKSVLEKAMEAARNLNVSYIGTEHLLLGLLSIGESDATTLLKEAGLTYANAFEAIQKFYAK